MLFVVKAGTAFIPGTSCGGFEPGSTSPPCLFVNVSSFLNASRFPLKNRRKIGIKRRLWMPNAWDSGKMQNHGEIWKYRAGHGRVAVFRPDQASAGLKHD